MNSKLIRVTCLLILIVTVLLTGATPVIAHSMDMAGAGSCHPAPGNDIASLPLCRVTTDCPLARTVTANLPPSPDQLNLSKLIQMVSLPSNRPHQSSSYQKAPCQQDTSQSIPYPPGADCPCRNSLQSEEPPLI